MATRRLKDLPKDLDTQISVDFNELLRKVHFGLSNNLKKRVSSYFSKSSHSLKNNRI